MNATEACYEAGCTSADARMNHHRAETGRAMTPDELDALADSLEANPEEWSLPDEAADMNHAEAVALCRRAETDHLRTLARALRDN